MQTLSVFPCHCTPSFAEEGAVRQQSRHWTIAYPVKLSMHKPFYSCLHHKVNKRHKVNNRCTFITKRKTFYEYSKGLKKHKIDAICKLSFFFFSTCVCKQIFRADSLIRLLSACALFTCSFCITYTHSLYHTDTRHTHVHTHTHIHSKTRTCTHTLKNPPTHIYTHD